MNRRWRLPRLRVNRARVSRGFYSGLALVGAVVSVAGIGMVSPPAAVILAGLMVGGLGLLGLGLQVSR